MPVRSWQILDPYLPVSLGAKADDILEKFGTGVSKKIHKANNLLQVASDGSNVNLLFLKLYEEKRCLNERPAWPFGYWNVWHSHYLWKFETCRERK